MSGYTERLRVNDHVGPGIYAEVTWPLPCLSASGRHTFGRVSQACVSCGTPARITASTPEPGFSSGEEEELERNFYGQPITPPEHFEGEHVANPGPAGMPPVCSCGWTRHEVDGRWFEMSDHLADMGASRPPAETEREALRREARQEAMLDAGAILAEYRQAKGE